MKTKAAFLMVLAGLVSGCDNVPTCADKDTQNSIIDELTESTSGKNKDAIEFGSVEQLSYDKENKRRSCVATVRIDQSKDLDDFRLEYGVFFDEKNSSYDIKYKLSEFNDIKNGFLSFDNAIEASKQFMISANGEEVTDKKTGLIWKRCAEGEVYDKKQNICIGHLEEYTFDAAQQHAQEIAASTGKPWRVPTKDELKFLSDSVRVMSEYPHIKTPFPLSGWFWSSSPYVGSTNYAWDVVFNNGYVDDYFRSHARRGAVSSRRLVFGFL